MNSFRFSLRQLMVLVVFAGVLLGLGRWLARRSSAFHRQATIHTEEAFNANLACRIDSRKVEYHEALALKYERAARFPWLPIEPDPPAP